MSLSRGYFEELGRLFAKPPEFVEAAFKIHDRKDRLPKFRTPDDGLNALISDLTSHYDTSPSMTKQEFTAECDINTIMRRFIASDFDPSVVPITNRQPRYGDFSAMPDSFHAALNYVKDTEQMFLQLPADLRSRFDNDPQNFLSWIEDPSNTEEMVKLGFAVAVPAASAPNNAGVAEGAGTPPARDDRRSTTKKAASSDATNADD